MAPNLEPQNWLIRNHRINDLNKLLWKVIKWNIHENCVYTFVLLHATVSFFSFATWPVNLRRFDLISEVAFVRHQSALGELWRCVSAVCFAAPFLWSQKGSRVARTRAPTSHGEGKGGSNSNERARKKRCRWGRVTWYYVRWSVSRRVGATHAAQSYVKYACTSKRRYLCRRRAREKNSCLITTNDKLVNNIFRHFIFLTFLCSVCSFSFL